MATKLKFNHAGKDYTLEFNKEQTKKLAQQGFTQELLVARPLDAIPMLFRGAFGMHHSNISKKTIEEIYEHMGDKEALLEMLIRMYAEPIEDLMVEPEEESKITWEQVA